MSFFKKLFGFGKKSEKKTASVHSHTSPKNGNLMLALEERYLYDAAGVAVAFEALTKPHSDAAADHYIDSDHTQPAEKTLPDIFKDAVPPAAHAQKNAEIVFVDPSVKDYQKIIESIPAKDQVIILDPNRDGVEQISEVLSQQNDVKAIHIVSHGSDASLTLGNAELSKDTLEKYAPTLSGWKDSLQQGADILIYGCEVAKTADGKAFVDQLSQLTGADTAASDDITGAADKGGDWMLEYQTKTGTIEVEGLSPRDYKYELATYTVNNNADVLNHADDATVVTLRDAVDSANNNPGADIINCNAGLGTITLTSSLDITGDVTINTNNNTIATGVNNLTIGSSNHAAVTFNAGGNNTRIFTINRTGTILENLAITNGSGIIVTSGELTLRTCSIYNNTFATTNGGGINISGGKFTMDTCTVSGNSATGNGGGIYIDIVGNTTIRNSTIYGNIADNNNNSAMEQGGGIYQNSGTVNITSSIIAGNRVDGAADAKNDLAGTFVSVTNSIYEVNKGTITDSTGSNVGDPNLSALANNGGNTLTHALQSTSTLAINKGSLFSSTDQRGVGRPKGDAVDIGAYESSFNPSITIAPGTASYTEGNSAAQIVSAADITISDTDGTKLQSASVTIPDFINTEDILAVGSSATITMTVDNSVGTVTLTSNSPTGASFSDYQNALASITFKNTSDNPSPARTANVTVTDMDGLPSPVGTRDITVIPANDPPTAGNTSLTFPLIGTAYPFAGGDFSTFFNDIDGDSFSGIVIQSLPSSTIGVLRYDGSDVVAPLSVSKADIDAGKLTFTRVANGDASFTFQVQDDSGAANNTSLASYTMTVKSNLNQSPIARDDTFAVLKNTPTTLNLLSNDYDPDSDPIAILSVSQPSVGSFNQATGIYTPPLDYIGGPISFSYTIRDSRGGTASATAYVKVQDTIIARPDEFSTDENTPVYISYAQMTSDDYNPDNYPLTVDIKPLISPDHGTLTDDPLNGRIIYTPDPYTFGKDSFYYSIAAPNGSVSYSTVTITVNAKADPPILTVPTDIVADEDQPLYLTPITAELADKTGTETLSVIISGIGMPQGSVLSNGRQNADGSWTLTSDLLTGLTLSTPADYSGTFSLKVAAVSTLNATGETAPTSKMISCKINPIADQAIWNIPTTGITGEKDTFFSLQIPTPQPGDTDGSESLSDVTISNVPSYVTFKIGADNGNGTWTVPPSQISGLMLKSTESGNFTLHYEVTSVETSGSRDNLTTVTKRDQPVSILPDKPNLEVSDVFVDEDTLIPLSIKASVNDPMAYLVLTDVTISGVPDGVSLSQGNKVLSDTWLVPNDQLVTLTMTPIPDSGDDIFLKASVSAVDPWGNTSTTEKTIIVDVTPKADPPNLSVLSPVYGINNAPAQVTVNSSLTDTDGSEVLSVNLYDLPAGASLSAGQDMGGGVWALKADDLQNLTITVPTGTHTFAMKVRAYSTETENGDQAYAEKTIDMVFEPFAADDTIITDKNTSKTFNPLDNDNAYQIKLQSYDIPAHGTVTQNADGTLTYTPAADYTGTDSFKYTIVDSINRTASAAVNITVGSVVLDAVDDTVTVQKNVITTIKPMDNDIRPAGTSVEKITQPSKGVLADNGDGTYSYQPGKDYTGQDSFTYTLSDGNGKTDTATVTITVSNTAPAAVDDAYSTDTGKALDITAKGVLVNDTDANGDTLTAVKVSDPANGKLTLNADGSFQYTPNTGFSGTDTFTYKANDGTADSANAATVTITVGEAALDAVDDTVTVQKNGAVTISPLSNDKTPAGTVMDKMTSPAHGTLIDNGSSTYIYQPDKGYVGTDSFTYTLSDGKGKTDTATVTITVSNTLPVAVDDNYITDQGKALTISAKGVLTNDTDSDGDTLTAVKATDPANGTLTLNQDGSFTYTPNTGFSGTDSFTYKANDGTADSAYATVTITVNPTTISANDDVYSTAKNTKVLLEPFKNDTPSSVVTFDSISPNPNGKFVDNMDGTYWYVPTTDFVGQEVYTYTISDGKGNISNSAKITINVTDTVINKAPVANADSYTTNQGTALTISAKGVLANDTDENGDTLTAIKDSDPANGTLTLNSDGSFQYTPNAGFTGTDSFTYKANDGKADSANAVVTIAVTGTGNRAPVAVNDSVTTDQGKAVTISFNTLKQNDYDLDGDPLTIGSGFSMPYNGTLTVTSDAVIYTPNSGFSGTDSFYYNVLDGKGGIAQGTVYVAVNKIANRAPDAVDDAVSTNQNQAVTISFNTLKQNDTDPDGDALSISPDYTMTANGKLEKTADAFVYTPNTGFSGTDSFVYTISDGKGGTDKATVSINVNKIGNRAPNAVDDAFSTNQNQAVTIGFANLVSNDTDADGDVLSVSPDYTMPANGKLVRNADSFVYTPNTGFTGTDSFTYIVSDGSGGSDSAKVTITVNAPYQPPVNPGTGYYDSYVPYTPSTPVIAADDTLSVPKNTSLNFKGSDILANDKTDGTRDLLSITSFTQPSHGSLVKKADGTFIYTPAQNYAGSDSFTYTVSDGQTSSTAKVNVSVLEAAGIIAKDDALSAKGTTIINAETILSNDIPVNTYDRLTITGFSQPSHGTLVDNRDNTFTYTPEAGYTGQDSFGYTVSDGRGNKASATVRLTVGEGSTDPIPGDDDPTDVNHLPVVTDDHLNATQDTPMTIRADLILSNDTDPDNDTLTVSGIEQPESGTLTDNGNGTYTYTPNAGFIGEDMLAYSVSDGRGGSATGVVYINVSSKDIPPDGENRSPIGVEDTLSTKVNTQLSIVKETLLKNDLDPDGDTLSLASFVQPNYGSIRDNGDGTLTYTPFTSFVGKDSFVYTVSDNRGGTASAKVTIYVNSNPVDKKNFPDAIDDEMTTYQNASATITANTMLANDKDPLGNPLTIIGYTQAYNGSVAKDSSGNYVYTPQTGFYGRDTFSYTVSNGKGGTDTAWVRITVAASGTRSADSTLTSRRSADPKVGSSTSEVQEAQNDAPAPETENIVVPVDSSITVTPLVIQAVSEEQTLTVPQEGMPYQKESYVSVSGQKVFDVKADRNYQEWIRTAVYDRNDILAANYGGGDNAEIIRYQAYFKARENDNPSLWKDQDTSRISEAAMPSVDKRMVAANENIEQTESPEKLQTSEMDAESSDMIPLSDSIESLFQRADANMLSFSEQVQLASGGFDMERTDFLSRLGALL